MFTCIFCYFHINDRFSKTRSDENNENCVSGAKRNINISKFFLLNKISVDEDVTKSVLYSLHVQVVCYVYVSIFCMFYKSV
jgi:hypothetical protein